MVQELLNVLKISNGFVVTNIRRDATYCVDEEAVATHVRLKLAEYAAEEATPQSRSAIPADEFAEMVKAFEAEKKAAADEGPNA